MMKLGCCSTTSSCRTPLRTNYPSLPFTTNEGKDAEKPLHQECHIECDNTIQLVNDICVRLGCGLTETGRVSLEDGDDPRQ